MTEIQLLRNVKSLLVSKEAGGKSITDGRNKDDTNEVSWSLERSKYK